MTSRRRCGGLRRSAAAAGAAGLVAAGLAALSALVAGPALTACGDEAGGGYEGCWRAADVALADCTLMKVWREGDDYRVRVDFEAPRHARVDGDALRVPGSAPGISGEEGPAGSADTLELRLRGGRAVLLRRTAADAPLEVELEALSEAAYEEQLAALCDDRVRTQVMELASAVRAWAEGHGGRPPAVPLLAAGSDFARSLPALGLEWPTNPFTGEPARPGTAPGDLAYATSGRDFELAGRLSDGEAYAAE